eukprot:9105735-Alexandrium_andersonii.AAC.1
MVEETPAAHVVHIVIHLPHAVPFQFSAKVIAQRPASGVSAVADSEHRLAQLPKFNVPRDEVAVL